MMLLPNNDNSSMPDMADLLTSMPASCIRLLTDIQYNFVEKNIVLRIIAIVLSFEVDGDVSLINHKRIDFCRKTDLGSFVSVSIFFLMAEQWCPYMVVNSL